MARRSGVTLAVLMLAAAACSTGMSSGDAAAPSSLPPTIPDPTSPPVTEALRPSTTLPTTSAPAATAAPTTSAPTTTSSTTTTTPLPPRLRLVVSAVGDVLLDPVHIPALRHNGYESAFTGTQDIFLRDDLTIINLECAVSELGRPLDKAFTFRCDTAALPIAREAGIEVANLANNHSGDFGPDALVDSWLNVNASGIESVGIGPWIEAAYRPAIFSVRGWTVAVLGFGGVVPAANWLATEDRPGMSSGDATELMVEAVQRADEIADLVFVTVHWGSEGKTAPHPDDVVRAHAMIDAGADGIFGHHPHRLQALEFYEGKPIAWSLGNFVWQKLSVASATTAIAQVIVDPDGSIEACLIPTYIERSAHPVVQVEYQGNCTW